jgi:hypothetical protein
MGPVQVTLLPEMSFDEAAIRLRTMWRVTRHHESFREVYAQLQEVRRLGIEGDLKFGEMSLERVDPDSVDWLANSAAWEHEKTEARAIMRGEFPLAHYIHFTWVIENHSRCYLDQFVRELTTGIQIWTGTTRGVDFSTFGEDGLYRNVQAVDDNPAWVPTRERHMLAIQEMYQESIDLGMRPEEARDILPLAVSIPMSATASLRQLRWIISKRSSYVAQAGLWGPVIAQMIEQLEAWDAGIARDFAQPPCLLRGMCPYFSDIEHRTTLNEGETMGPHVTQTSFAEQNPVCPMYVDMFAKGDEWEEMLQIARWKHPDWDNKVARPYFDRVGHTPNRIQLLPAL